MNDKVKILISGLIVFVFGYIIIDFVSDYKSEVNTVEEAVRITNENKEVSENKEASEAPGVNIGDLAYDFELVDMDNNLVKLSDFRGQKVLLNFWASWCPPCRIEAPHLQKLHEDNEQDIVVLGVNVTTSESDIENVKEFIDEFDLTFVNLYESNNISFVYNVYSMPTSYFIDSNGIIRDVAVGAVNEDIVEDVFSTMEWGL